MPAAEGRFAIVLIAACAITTGAAAQNTCEKPVYLTFDTGHMGIAPLVADVLKRQNVRVTFFGAAERTQTDGDSLDNHWASWWKARAVEGNEFGSHTYDHVYWRGDDKSVAPRFRVKPSAGAFAGREFTWSAAEYCENITKASDQLALVTGKKPLPLFRAPGGKTSPKLLAAAKACGYEHVGWAPAGFLGDELPSEKFSNEKLLAQALDKVQPGDILLAHLGIWSRKDPWAPANLEPLIVGLKAKGFCFETLRQHPAYRAWIAAHP
ncbi:MAG: polysaccharide deacetylase family protein [Comamonadaceae bacterium]|nr:MAG: polysaccharide deacetylase family protein [Comamonadaceae bacterium]